MALFLKLIVRYVSVQKTNLVIRLSTVIVVIRASIKAAMELVKYSKIKILFVMHAYT